MDGRLGAVGSFVHDAASWIYGGHIDDRWGTAMAIFVTVVAIAFAIGGYRSVHELGKAWDIRFNKLKLEEYNLNREEGTPPRLIDWKKARKQQVRSLRFTIPFGILVFATLYLWFRNSFALETYFQLAACWLVFLVLLRVWWIAVAVWTERKLEKKELAAADRPSLHGVTIGWAIQHYLNWGLEKSTKKRPPYIGLFRFLNPLVKLFGLRWLQIRLVRPLFNIAFFACTWGVSMPVAVWYLTHEFDKRTQILKPDWASRHAPEPTYSSGAIRDTRGDAAAANS